MASDFGIAPAELERRFATGDLHLKGSVLATSAFDLFRLVEGDCQRQDVFGDVNGSSSSAAIGIGDSDSALTGSELGGIGGGFAVIPFERVISGAAFGLSEGFSIGIASAGSALHLNIEVDGFGRLNGNGGIGLIASRIRDGELVIASAQSRGLIASDFGIVPAELERRFATGDLHLKGGILATSAFDLFRLVEGDCQCCQLLRYCNTPNRATTLSISNCNRVATRFQLLCQLSSFAIIPFKSKIRCKSPNRHRCSAIGSSFCAFFFELFHFHRKSRIGNSNLSGFAFALAI